MPDPLPRGFFKEYTKGYGFTRVLNGLLYALESKFTVPSVIVSGTRSTSYKNYTLVLNANDLDRLYPQLKSLFDEQRGERDILVNNVLAGLFPSKFKKKSPTYAKGSLNRFIGQNIVNHNDLSSDDVTALLELVNNVSRGRDILSKKQVLRTKEKIEEYYIEEVIGTFQKMLNQKGDSPALEKKWQKFFKEYSWVFSQMFSYPVLMFEDEAFVGGKSIKGTGGKVSDFIYKNHLTDNIAIIEIKTHRTALLSGKKAYRGKDVFAISKDLTGAINQVLDQRDNLQKDFYGLKAKSDKPFETYNSRCLLVVGLSSLLSNSQKKSFELYRSNSRDVDIVTFDELFNKIKGFSDILFTGGKKKKRKGKK